MLERERQRSIACTERCVCGGLWWARVWMGMALLAFAAAIGGISRLLESHAQHDPSYLAVVAIFKNEASGLCEWLRHHVSQGVGTFYLIDNGSTDDWRQSIKGLLTPESSERDTETWLLSSPHMASARVIIVRDATKHKQVELYNQHFLERVREHHHWVLVIDIDEFVYAAKEGQTIVSVLQMTPSHVASIWLLWKMFGGLPKEATQPSSIIHGFTSRANVSTAPAFGEIKAVTRTGCLERMGIHSHELTLPCRLLRLPAFPAARPIVSPLPLLWRLPAVVRRYPPHIDEESVRSMPLQLNHYPVQSLDWFMKTKSTRGAADIARNEHIRNKAYYVRYNRTEILDAGLSQLTPSRRDLAVTRASWGYCPGDPLRAISHIRAS